MLFACYTLLREQAGVVTVFGGDERRQHETWEAMDLLDVPHEEWTVPHDRRDIFRWMEKADDGEVTVWAPMVEEGGHLDHNLVGWAAADVFGDRCRFYATYKRGHGRTRTDNEVIPEPDWYAKKFNAMSCYVSQINHPQMRPWFCSDDMLREWIL